MVMYARNHITPDSALGGWQMKRSLRWEQNDSAYLYRTGSSPTGGGKYSYSSWIKRVDLSGQTCLWGAGGGTQTNTHAEGIYITGSDQIALIYRGAVGSGSVGWYAYASAELRDTTSWVHVMLTYDNNQSGIANKIKYYFNGVEISYGGGVGSPGDLEFVNKSGVTQYIGRMDQGGGPGYARVYQAETHVADGYIWTPSDFGYTDANTGQWRPKRPEDISVNYGNNGFYLDYADNTSTSTIGIDKSGNSNNWTASGFNVGSGIDNDSVEDTPTNDWCVWNRLTDVSDITLSEGNLKAVSGADSWPAIFGTHGVSSGKWYYEAVGADNTRWGLGWSTEDFKSGTSNTFSEGHFAYSQDPLTFYQDGSNSAINGTPAFTTGDVLQIATDIDAGKTWFGINNTWVNASNGSAGDPAAGTNPTITFSEKGQKHYPKMINNLGNVSVNFGQQGFAYTPPAGFQALNSKNLATVNAAGVVNPRRHFDTLLYTGNGTSGHSISGLEFKPDFIWIKNRDATYYHCLSDTVRGITRSSNSNASDAEVNYSNISAVHENGFVVGAAELVNKNSQNLVAWCWKAGGAAVTNTVGNISAQVSANDEAGFSIITYTGDGNSSGNVGTGLRSTQPLDWAIVKRRDSTSDWHVGHSASGQGVNFAYHLNLNSTDQLSGSAPYHMGTQNATNGDRLYLAEGGLTSSATYVAYVWQERPGYSKFGSYTGNGSSDGPYVHLGFKPAFVMVKSTNASEHWNIPVDTYSYNGVDKTLSPNLTNAERDMSGGDAMDFLSNGFKIRNSDNNYVNSGKTFIYMAFAEQPSKTMFGLDANAR